MSHVYPLFTLLLLPKRKKTLRPSFSFLSLPPSFSLFASNLLARNTTGAGYPSSIFYLSSCLFIISCRTGIMPPKTTDLVKLDTDELVKYVTQYTGFPVPKPDVKVMRKSNITGFSLVHSGTEQAFEKVGLSWGTGTNLMRIKENYLGKKKR